MEHTRVQKALLATLRATLRHIRRECNVRGALPPTGAAPTLPAAPTAAPAPRDVSHFTSFVLAEYRKGAAVKDRARVRQLRSHATDVLGYFQATVQQNDLLALQRGSDPDKEMARSAAARFVGLTIPEGVPLGQPTAPAKYMDTVSARLSGRLEDTKLEGVDYLKAQYYGAKAVIDEKREK